MLVLHTRDGEDMFVLCTGGGEDLLGCICIVHVKI